ncbi:MAG TPA: DNA cytosine methyltransferase [Methylophilaceae bacterium]|nr:DNA cytosine methyltransferase [Methylophilaceae bacterium]
MSIKAVDLFCGAGGLTHGLISSGINVVAGYDIDPICKWAYEKNNKGAKFFHTDVSKVSGKDIETHLLGAEIRLLAGCAPCQPFSTYSLGKTDQQDKRWTMLDEFARLVDETEPDLITMENVPQLLKHEIFQKFKSHLEELGYEVTSQVIACADYGIPQDRKRLVLLASRLGGPLSVRPRNPRKDRVKTVRQAIGSMPPIKAGEVHYKDKLHAASDLNEINLKRIRNSKPGGSWKDWDESLISDCHKSETGKSFGSVYGRMEWSKPSPTITTQFYGFGNGRFGHPEQDRALSLREGAILQSFPKRYSFVPKKQVVETRNIGRLIGNAVPVKLGKVIGESIIEHVRLYRPHALI